MPNLKQESETFSRLKKGKILSSNHSNYASNHEILLVEKYSSTNNIIEFQMERNIHKDQQKQKKQRKTNNLSLSALNQLSSMQQQNFCFSPIFRILQSSIPQQNFVFNKYLRCCTVGSKSKVLVFGRAAKNPIQSLSQSNCQPLSSLILMAA